MTKRFEPDYGIDGPDVLKTMLTISAVGAGLSGFANIAMKSRSTAVRWAGKVAAYPAGLALVYGAGMAAYMIYDARIAKVRWRETLLDQVGQLASWTGQERVLDVGCGRGLLLIGAARRLTTGKAVGVDIWRKEDQSSNSAAATLDNARLEGVADRVEVHTADCRQLPFPDASYDVVLSRWTLHNLPQAGDRARAIDEITRVLKPGGVLAIADIANLAEYRGALLDRGFADLRISDGGLGTMILGALSGGTFKPMSLLARRG